MLKSGKKNIGKNITELKKDNMKSGKEKGTNGTPRPMKQIVAIALSTAKVPKMIKGEGKKEQKMDKKMGAKEMKKEIKEYKSTPKKR